MLNLDESGVNKITRLLCISLMKKKSIDIAIALPIPLPTITTRATR
jgi:hypothetical protein